MSDCALSSSRHGRCLLSSPTVPAVAHHSHTLAAVVIGASQEWALKILAISSYRNILDAGALESGKRRGGDRSESVAASRATDWFGGVSHPPRHATTSLPRRQKGLTGGNQRTSLKTSDLSHTEARERARCPCAVVVQALSFLENV